MRQTYDDRQPNAVYSVAPANRLAPVVKLESSRRIEELPVKRIWKHKVWIAAAAVILGPLVWVNYILSSIWEDTLWGPYTGAPYPSESLTQPASTLPMPGGSQLEIHEPANQIVPVLALRRTDGAIAWARLLVPQSESNRGNAGAFIHNLRFEKLKRSWHGFRVFIVCDWAAGHEEGIVYLDRDLSFESFRLSW